MTPGTAAIEDLNLSSGTDEGTPWSRMNEADLTAQAKERQQDEVADRFVNKSYPGEGHSRRLSRVRCGSGWKHATTQHEVEGKLLTDDRDDETDSGIRVHLPFIVCQPNEQSRSDDSDVSELCGSHFNGVSSEQMAQEWKEGKPTASPSTCRNTPLMFMLPSLEASPAPPWPS